MTATITITFAGESFRVAEAIGLMPLMQFSAVAKGGSENSLDSLVAMHNLLRECLADEEEWQRFQNHATKVRADADTLMEFVKTVIEVLSERPTQRPSDLPDGPGDTVASSEDDSSSQVIRQFEEKGRPDLALVLRRMNEASA